MLGKRLSTTLTATSAVLVLSAALSASAAPAAKRGCPLPKGATVVERNKSSVVYRMDKGDVAKYIGCTRSAGKAFTLLRTEDTELGDSTTVGSLRLSGRYAAMSLGTNIGAGRYGFTATIAVFDLAKRAVSFTHRVTVSSASRPPRSLGSRLRAVAGQPGSRRRWARARPTGSRSVARRARSTCSMRAATSTPARSHCRTGLCPGRAAASQRVCRCAGARLVERVHGRVEACRAQRLVAAGEELDVDRLAVAQRPDVDLHLLELHPAELVTADHAGDDD